MDRVRVVTADRRPKAGRPSALAGALDGALASALAGALLLVLSPATVQAKEDLEYVGEHLPEGAMNYRYATLPLWSPAGDGWTFTAQGAWGRSKTGGLGLSGPLGALAATRRLSSAWTLTGFGFHDRMRFSGNNEDRPLEVRFARNVPLTLPADARFDRLGGTTTDYGLGLALGHEISSGWLSGWRLTVGTSIQNLRLSDYASQYQLLSGPSAGTTGRIDYSASYRFVSLLTGLSRRWERGDWALTPHALFAMPFPRRGVKGRITGPGFDIAGDTADAGAGRHYGDATLALGLDLEYRPWQTSFDVGALLSQPLLEPTMHKGMDSSLVLSASFRF